jgi:hypothetical protein
VGGNGQGDVCSPGSLVQVVVRDVLAGRFVFEVERGDVGGDESGSVGRDCGCITFGSQVGVVLVDENIISV